MTRECTPRYKKRKLSSMDVDVMEDDEDHEWNMFFQLNLNNDSRHTTEKNTCLRNSGNGVDIEVTQIEVEKYIECLLKIPTLYNSVKTCPNSLQKQYMLMMASCVAREERNFIKSNLNNSYKTVVQIADIKNPNTDINVKIEYIEVLKTLFDHVAGLKWLLETNYWIDIYNLVIEFQRENESVSHIAYNLLTEILQKTSKIAPKICNHIIKQMVQSLVNTAIRHLAFTKKASIIPLQVEICNQLNPALICLIEILERLLSSPAADILKIFIKLQVREASDTLAILSDDEDFSLRLIRIMIILSFYEMTDLFDGIKVVNHDPLALSGFVRVVERELKKGHYKCMLNVYYFSQKYWKNISRKMPKYFVKEVSIDIEDELIPLQIEPMVIIAEKILGVTMEREELRTCFLTDLLNRCSVSCLHLGYEIRKYLSQQPLNIDVISLQCLIKSKPFYSRKSLATVFQGLIYSLKDFIKYVKLYPKGLLDKDEDLADALLETILVYLENFDLSWRESIGSIELTNLVYDFLYYSVRWPAKTVLKALEILNTTISKHMSPNMALLVDTTQHSSLDDLGSLLFTKCFSDDSDVRNATLIVVNTLCQKANKGFKSFKNIIFGSLLQDLISTMSVSDSDAKVRTTAFKCLQEIVVMDDVGNSLLNNDLVDKVLEIIKNEEEQVIAKEALILLGIIFQIDKIPKQCSQKMFNILEKVSTNDDKSLVQEYAIRFWNIVFDKYLEEYGWIDEEFPPVIFSKDQKKIIRLDDKEIRKRLLRVAEKLSETGVYNVFCHFLQSENISKNVYSTALISIKKYLKIIKRYEITPEFILLSQAVPNLWSIQTNFLSPSHQMEELIEESVMEMINGSDAYFKGTSFVTNDGTSESFRGIGSQTKNMTMADVLDLLSRKLPINFQSDDYKNIDVCNDTGENSYPTE